MQMGMNGDVLLLASVLRGPPEYGLHVDPIPHPPKKQHFNSISAQTNCDILLRKTISFTEDIS